MGESENVARVREMWAAYDKGGLEAILDFAAPDAEWRPYSAQGRVFAGTDEYRAFIAEMGDRGEVVESRLFDVHAQNDCVVASGRLRLRSTDGMWDYPMHWVHRFRDGQIVWTASFPELAKALEAAGLGPADRITL